MKWKWYVQVTDKDTSDLCKWSDSGIYRWLTMTHWTTWQMKWQWYVQVT